MRQNKNVLHAVLNLCAVEVSRGREEIRLIRGKIGPSAAIKNSGPDARSGSGSCPGADCQRGGTATSAYSCLFCLVSLNTHYCSWERLT